MALSRGLLGPAGVAGLAGFVTWNLLVEWPGGDPSKALDAADYYDMIGKTVTSSLVDLSPIIAEVMKNSPSKGATGFKGYLDKEISPYNSQVADYCTTVAEAYRQYGKLLSQTQRTLITMAVANYLQMIFAVCWMFTGLGSAKLAEAIADQIYRRIAAKNLVGILAKILAETVVKKVTTYTVGSAIYAVGSQALTEATDVGGRLWGGGQPVGTVGSVSSNMLKNFIACLPFFGLYDATKLGPLIKIFPDNVAGNAGSYLIGSNSFTISYNLLNGESLGQSIPRWPQLAKVMIYATMQARQPVPGGNADPSGGEPPAAAPPAAAPPAAAQGGGAPPAAAPPAAAPPAAAPPAAAPPAAAQGGGAAPPAAAPPAAAPPAAAPPAAAPPVPPKVFPPPKVEPPAE